VPKQRVEEIHLLVHPYFPYCKRSENDWIDYQKDVDALAAKKKQCLF